MPGDCSSSLRCRMVCVTRPSHHSLSIIYIHYIYFEIESCIAIFLSFFRRRNQFSQQLGYLQESRGRVLHVSNYGLSAPGLSAPHLGSSVPGLIWCKFCCVSLGIDRDRTRFIF